MDFGETYPDTGRGTPFGRHDSSGLIQTGKSYKQVILEWWDWLALHVWLFTSSYGIMFAILSFLDEMGVLDALKVGRPWIKGVLAASSVRFASSVVVMVFFERFYVLRIIS